MQNATKHKEMQYFISIYLIEVISSNVFFYLQSPGERVGTTRIISSPDVENEGIGMFIDMV